MFAIGGFVSLLKRRNTHSHALPVITINRFDIGRFTEILRENVMAAESAPSETFTVMLKFPGIGVGQIMSPAALMVMPVGAPVKEYCRVCPTSASVAWICHDQETFSKMGGASAGVVVITGVSLTFCTVTVKV